MIEGRPSDTAMQVAAARAAHLRFDPPPHLLEDRVAEALLGDEAEALVAGYSDDGPWILVENRIFLPLRARYVEDRLADAFSRGVRQLVVLGAGLDSFAFRRPAEWSDLRVFEVDHPSTQQWKQRRLADLGWRLPAGVEWVPCDFEVDTLRDALAGTGFDPAAPAVVSWMGVVYYLEPATFEGALAELAGLLAPGSEVVFDAMRPWDELPERYHALREAMGEYLNRAGEPQINRPTEAALVAAIRDAGFDEAIVESREAIAKRYLAPTGTTIPLAERFRLVVARRTGDPATDQAAS